jgi:hypothetical protein
MNIHKIIPSGSDYTITVYESDSDAYGKQIEWKDVPNDIQDWMMQCAHENGTYRLVDPNGKEYRLLIY